MNRKAPFILVQFILILVVAFGVLLLLTNDLNLFIRIFYNPYSFLILAVAIVEYIILKAMDRSRMYRLENQRLKRKRRRDMDMRREVESRIRNVMQRLDESESTERLKKELEDIVRTVRRI